MIVVLLQCYELCQQTAGHEGTFDVRMDEESGWRETEMEREGDNSRSYSETLLY